jgi:DNA-binding GntR family transcriptional regulator
LTSSKATDGIPRRKAQPRTSPYERIKEAIMSGELTPGEQLVESWLAEWCQVSRTPIREALMRLEQDGLVTRGDHGLVVRDSSPGEILDLYETRVVLERRAAIVAAERRTSHDLSAIRRAEEQRMKVGVDDPHGMAASNREFHRCVWRASHDGSLIDLLERLDMHLGRYPATTLTYPGRLAESHDEHLALIAALEKRQAKRAGDISAAHFAAARDIRLRLWEE